MVEQARTKLTTAGLPGRFLVGEALAPPTGDQRFDAVLSRHLIWTVPEPKAALTDWVSRVRPGGRLVMVEGRWGEAGCHTPYVDGAESLPWHGGVSADDLSACVRPLVRGLRVESLSGDSDLWGRPVADERYVLLADV